MSAELMLWSPREYHEDSSLSHSGLDTFLDDPALYYGRYLSKQWPREESDALEFGSVFHERFLFGRPLKELVCEIPANVLTSNGQRRGKAWEEWSAEQRAAGVTPMVWADLCKLEAMLAGIARHKRARWIFEQPGAVECPIRWEDDLGILRRSLLDKFIQGKIIADLKSAASVKPYDFAYAADKYGYARQAAYYREAVLALTGELLDFVFVACKKSPPYTCEVIELDAEFVAFAHEENQRGLREWRACWERYAATGDAEAWQRPESGDIITVPMPGSLKYKGDWRYEPSLDD